MRESFFSWFTCPRSSVNVTGGCCRQQPTMMWRYSSTIFSRPLAARTLWTAPGSLEFGSHSLESIMLRKKTATVKARKTRSCRDLLKNWIEHLPGFCFRFLFCVSLPKKQVQLKADELLTGICRPLCAIKTLLGRQVPGGERRLWPQLAAQNTALSVLLLLWAELRSRSGMD